MEVMTTELVQKAIPGLGLAQWARGTLPQARYSPSSLNPV